LSLLAVANIECVDEQGNYGRFVAEPLENGFGVTLGNTLRRVLLGYLPGAAITQVRIESILHEFSTIPNVKEDTIDFLLNVKAIRLKALSDRPGKLSLVKEGEGKVYAGDITPTADFEIINPDQYLATVDSPDASLDIEFEVNLGVGYVPAESSDDASYGTIPVDAIYTPMRKVNFHVKPFHIGQEVTRESLEIEIWTDGTITPSDAISESARLLVEQLNPFVEYPKASLMPSDEDSLRLQIPDEQYNMPVDQLDLSVRTMNCLRRASIATVGELITRGEKELLALRNFGQKSKIELEEKLAVIGLSLDPSSNDGSEDAEADGEAAITEDGAVTELEADAASPEIADDSAEASSTDETN
jgi:DNA-directed RNA polymerase subunit alpha